MSEIPDKIVLCYRCLYAYNLRKAPKSKAKGLEVMEPHCPRCKRKVYFS